MFSNRKIILIIILLVTVSITAYFLLVVIPAKVARQSYEGAKEIGRDFREAFQFTPEVRVKNTIVLQQQASIFEVATLNQKFHHQYHWTNTWMNSTKTVTLSGTLDAKAGFDLNQKFIIHIDGDKAVVTLPEPELLSLEPLDDMKFEDENGYWNWVNNEDRSAAMNAFINDARSYSSSANFVNDAKASMEEKINAMLQSHGITTTFRYERAQKIPSPQ